MRRDSIVLALAFVAVAAAFVASTVVAQRAAREVSVLAASIARDAAPGLASMSNVRSEVRRLQELVTRVALLDAGSTEPPQRAPRGVTLLAAPFGRDAAPGLASMSNVRSEVRRLRELVPRVALLDAGSPALAEMDEPRRNLDAHLADFRSLPASQDEL